MNYYPVKEICQSTGIPESEFVDVLRQNKIEIRTEGKADCISAAAMHLLFPGLLNESNEIGKKWELSQLLKNLELPWAVTLRELYRSGLVFPSSLSPAQGEIYRSLVFNAGPKHIVEIGSFLGVSLIWAGSALLELGAQGKITAIDTFADKLPNKKYWFVLIDDVLNRVTKNIEKAGLSNLVDLVKENSVTYGTDYKTKNGKPIDILFIDGNHSIRGCLADFNHFSPFVREGGYLVLHDIYPEVCKADGPRYLLDRVVKFRPEWECVEYHTHPINFGMAVLRKKRVGNLKILLYKGIRFLLRVKKKFAST